MDISLLASFIFAPRLLEDLKFSSQEFRLSAIINVLKTPTEKRTSRSLVILKFLSSTIPFFKTHVVELGDAVHMQLCQQLDYEYFEPDKVIFNADRV